MSEVSTYDVEIFLVMVMKAAKTSAMAGNSHQKTAQVIYTCRLLQHLKKDKEQP